MDSTALSKRYPLMRFAPENIGYHETVAGSLYADRALTAYQAHNLPLFSFHYATVLSKI